MAGVVAVSVTLGAQLGDHGAEQQPDQGQGDQPELQRPRLSGVSRLLW